MMTNNVFKMVKNTNNTVLDDIAEGYIRRIQSVLAKLKYKTVVLDFDGTLTEFRYSFNSLLPQCLFTLQVYEVLRLSFC